MDLRNFDLDSLPGSYRVIYQMEYKAARAFGLDPEAAYEAAAERTLRKINVARTTLRK